VRASEFSSQSFRRISYHADRSLSIRIDASIATPTRTIAQAPHAIAPAPHAIEHAARASRRAIAPAGDGKSLRVVWRRWALIGSKAGQLVDPHITSEIIWHLEGSTLTRDETLKSTEPITIRRWWMAVPTTAAHNESSLVSGRRMDHFAFSQDRTDLSITGWADWPLKISLLATGDTALGRGARGAIPLHLIYESWDMRLTPNRADSWHLVIKLAPLAKPFE